MLAGTEHITGLIPTCGGSRDDVDAVDRGYGQQALAEAVANLDCVVGARSPGHPILTMVIMRAQYDPAVSVDDRHFGNATHRLRIADRRQRKAYREIQDAFHVGSIIETLKN